MNSLTCIYSMMDNAHASTLAWVHEQFGDIFDHQIRPLEIPLPAHPPTIALILSDLQRMYTIVRDIFVH